MKEDSSVRPARLDIGIERDPAVIADASQQVASFFEGRACQAEAVFRLQVALAEVLNNLYEHGVSGAGAAGGPWVRLRARVSDTSLRVLLVEHGACPFELSGGRRPDPWSESGRGLFIVETWLHTFRVRHWRNDNCWLLAASR